MLSQQKRHGVRVDQAAREQVVPGVQQGFALAHQFGAGRFPGERGFLEAEDHQPLRQLFLHGAELCQRRFVRKERANACVMQNIHEAFFLHLPLHGNHDPDAAAHGKITQRPIDAVPSDDRDVAALQIALHQSAAETLHRKQKLPVGICSRSVVLGSVKEGAFIRKLLGMVEQKLHQRLNIEHPVFRHGRASFRFLHFYFI